MTVVGVFAELRSKYSSWPLLKDFLESPAGGKLSIVGSGNYVVIRYDKKTSDFTIPYTHAFRSVVWDTVSNLPVSVAPFKATELSTYTGTVDLVQDFVEGVMLHVFRVGEKVGLSTRTKLGAATRFYSRRNFSELIEDIPNWQSVCPVVDGASSSFASIVLQHPEHRVVAPIHEPRIYVVNIGSVAPNGLVEIRENPEEWPATIKQFAPETLQMDLAPEEFLKAEAIKRGVYWQGVVFKNSERLNRCRMRNPNYTTLRELRGSEADSFVRFLRLRKANQLNLYVAHYPEETQEFMRLEARLSMQVAELFKYYNESHRGSKAQRKNINDIPWPHKVHVFKLHGNYLTTKVPITLDTVLEYVNSLDTQKQRAFLIPAVGQTQTNMTED